MKDVIISEKAKEEEILSEGIMDTTMSAKVVQVSSSVYLAGR